MGQAWGMRGARTGDGLLAQVPPSIVMSRSSGIALSDSRADLPRTTMLMPAHLRGAKQGDGLTGRQWRREWAKDGAKPHSPADRSTRPLGPIQRKSNFTPYRHGAPNRQNLSEAMAWALQADHNQTGTAASSRSREPLF